DPPMVMSAGNGPVPDGLVMVELNEMELPPLPTVTARVVPFSAPVTVDGLAGLVPSSYSCACAMISARRQTPSALAAIRVPESDLNGSGSFVLAVRAE